MTSKIIIWGRESSSNVQKILWMLDELDLDYERRDAGEWFGVVDTPEYLAMNPNGKIPTLQHGDLVLWESHAILRYLAAKFGGEDLWPTDPVVRASIDQWEVWAGTTLIPAIGKVFYAEVRTQPIKRDLNFIKNAAIAAHKPLRILNERLAVSDYVAGERFSIADITCAIQMHRWHTMDIERQPMPNVERWITLLQQRPGYRKWGKFSYETLRGID